jgi:cytosine/adenosine deaminase-related metal-dependent hydrolase
MSILIKNTTILTQNSTRQQRHGDVYIEDHQIVELSEKPLTVEAEFKIDGTNQLYSPGFLTCIPTSR